MNIEDTNRILSSHCFFFLWLFQTFSHCKIFAGFIFLPNMWTVQKESTLTKGHFFSLKDVRWTRLGIERWALIAQLNHIAAVWAQVNPFTFLCLSFRCFCQLNKEQIGKFLVPYTFFFLCCIHSNLPDLLVPGLGEIYYFLFLLPIPTPLMNFTSVKTILLLLERIY